MFKRCISLILVLVTLVSFLPVPSRAAEVTTDGTQVDFEATNDFGALLTNSLDGSDQAQTSSDANRICDLQFEGDYAWVEFVTTEKANLVVAIYTEDGTQMLGSGTETVSPEETEVGIQIDIENMPQYYSAGAYLLSAEDNTPLSQEFRTQLYTKAVQDIKNSTVDDYDPERVLNLDDDRTTNFAVFGENTILLDSDVVVTVSGDTYTIENAPDELKAMQPGDSFAQMPDNGEMLIVKAAKVKVNGDTVIVTDDPDADLSDVFEVVKIEGQSTEDNTTFDFSTLDPDLKIATEEELYAMTGERTARKEWDDEYTVEIPLVSLETANFELGLTVTPSLHVTAYISLSYQYINLEVSAVLKGSVSLKTEFRRDFSIFNAECTLACGCNVHLTYFFFVEASGKLTYEIDLTVAYAKTYDSDLDCWEGTPNIQANKSLTEEVSLYIGFGYKVGADFLSEKLTSIDFASRSGLELSAERELWKVSTDYPDYVHPCDVCFIGKLKEKYTTDLEFSLFGKKKAGIPFREATRVRGGFYYCLDDKKGGWGDCPHMTYGVTLTMKDPTGVPLPEVSVKIFDASAEEVTEAIQVKEHKSFMGAIPNSDDDGVVRIYLTNGRYTAECTTPEETKTVSFTVYKTAKNIPVVLTSATAAPYLSLGEKSSIAYIGVEQQLKATFGSSTLRQDVSKAATWTSSDTDVIRVEQGTLTPVSVGTATISVAYQADGNKYRTSIPVQVLPRFGFTLSESQVSFATTKTYQLSAFFRDGDQDTAVNSSCIWTSSDPGVVTVDNGLLTPVSAGTATVTAVYYNGDEEMQATCEVEITEVKIVDEGQCGDNVYWKLDEEGTLTLYGSGTTYNYTYSDSPWYYSQPNKLIVEDGVTSIGDRLFNKCKQLSSISIPDSVTIIGSSAFSYCTSLTSVVIPDSVISLGSHAFWHCEVLSSEVVLPVWLPMLSLTAPAFPM